MTKNRLNRLILFLLLFIRNTYISRENTTKIRADIKRKIKGWMNYDDLTKSTLTGLKVWADGIPDTLYTKDSGRFHYTKINMPRGEFI